MASLVTICMPSYNYGRFLPHAVDSVLGQSHVDLELLIVDNGSSDGSYEIAQEYAAGDERVRVLAHSGRVNRGVNASLNLGLAEARGAYFGLLPADDLCLPDGLERRVELLDRSPDAGFVYGRSLLFDEAGASLGQLGGRAPDDMLVFDATPDLLQALLFHDFVPGAAAISRIDLLRDIGGYSEAVYFNDWYVTIRMLARTSCAFVPGDPVVGYRLHERHRSEDNRDADRPRRLELFRALWSVAGTTGDRLDALRTRALIGLQRAVHANRLGDIDETMTAISDALAVDPSLRTDGPFLLWWLDPRHGEWSLAVDGDSRRAFVAALGRPSATVDDIVAASGSDYASFAALVLAALPEDTRTWLGWGVVAEQLEALGGGPHPWMTVSLLARTTAQPSLLRLRPFVKVVLCASGFWPLAARLRRLRAATTIAR